MWKKGIVIGVVLMFMCGVGYGGEIIADTDKQYDVGIACIRHNPYCKGSLDHHWDYYCPKCHIKVVCWLCKGGGKVPPIAKPDKDRIRFDRVVCPECEGLGWRWSGWNWREEE